MRFRSLRPWLQAGVVCVILFFWGRAVMRSWDELAGVSWRIDWPWLLAGQAALLAQSLLLATIWWWGLALVGRPMPWRLGVALWLQTQIARYVPGGVWDVAGRLTLGRQKGLSVRAMSASTGLEMALQVLSASLFLLLVPWLRGDAVSDAYAALAVALGLACLLALAPPAADGPHDDPGKPDQRRQSHAEDHGHQPARAAIPGEGRGDPEGPACRDHERRGHQEPEGGLDGGGQRRRGRGAVCRA